MESNCTDELIRVVTESDKLRQVVIDILRGDLLEELGRRIDKVIEAVDIAEEDIEYIEEDIVKTNVRIGRLHKKLDEFIEADRKHHFWDGWF